MTDIFISYAREESEYVASLRDELQALDLTVWVDLDRLYAGEEFSLQVAGAIEGADQFVFVISPSSAASEWCHQEAEHAQKYNKRVLPVNYRECDTESLPEIVRKRQWILPMDASQVGAVARQIQEALESDPGWIREHTRLLVLAKRWEQNNEDRSLTLRGSELQQAEAWLAGAAGKQPEVTPLHARFITRSRQVVGRRQRLTLTAVSTALVFTFVLAVVAFWQRWIAEERRQIATARQLAAEAELARDRTVTGLERSLLLAVESLRTRATFEGRLAWTHAVELLPERPIELSHDGEVRAIVFSADGELLASASRQSGVKLWNARSGDLLHELLSGSGVTRLAFGTNAAWLAAATWGGKVFVWDIRTARVLVEYERRDGVTSLTAAPDGTYVASGHYHGALVVWQPGAQAPQLDLKTDGPVTQIAFSPDGKVLAFATGRVGVRIMRLIDGMEIASLPHEWPVTALAFNPKGTQLATGADCVQDDTRCTTPVAVWDLEKGNRLAVKYMKGQVQALRFSANGDNLFAATDRGDHAQWSEWRWLEQSSGVAYGAKQIAMSADGNLLASTGNDQTARLWTTSGSRELVRFWHEEPVGSIALSPDGRVATGTLKGRVFVWPSPSGSARHRFSHDQAGAARGVTAVAFTPDGALLASAGVDRTARLWNTTTGAEVARISHDGPVGHVTLSPDGKLLASAEACYFGCDAALLILSETETGRPRWHVTLSSSINSVAFSPDGTMVAAGTFKGEVKVWNTSSGELTASFDSPSGHEIRTLAFNPIGDFLAAADGCPGYGVCKEATVRLWSCRDWSLEASLEHGDGLRDMTFSPEGELLATACSDGGLRLWDLSKNTVRTRIDNDEAVDTLAFSPDGRLLAAGGLGGQEGTISGLLRMIDVNTAAELYSVPHDWPVIRTVFSPDGSHVVTATSVTTYVSSNEGWRIRLFATDSGEELGRVEQVAPVLDIQFSPDGRWLAASGRDNTATIWPWRESDLVDMACRRLTRNLSAWEWENHFTGEEYRETCAGLPKPDSLPVPRDKRYLKIMPSSTNSGAD